jgi:hypothetical protein
MAVDRIGCGLRPTLLLTDSYRTAHHDFCDPSILTFVRSGLKQQRESHASSWKCVCAEHNIMCINAIPHVVVMNMNVESPPLCRICAGGGFLAVLVVVLLLVCHDGWCAVVVSLLPQHFTSSSHIHWLLYDTRTLRAVALRRTPTNPP